MLLMISEQQSHKKTKTHKKTCKRVADYHAKGKEQLGQNSKLNPPFNSNEANFRKWTENKEVCLAYDQQKPTGEPPFTPFMFTACFSLWGAKAEMCGQVLPTQLSPTYSQLPFDW